MNNKMRCIDNQFYQERLTLNKYYLILSEDSRYYTVIDDNGSEVVVFKYRFINKSKIYEIW